MAGSFIEVKVDDGKILEKLKQLSSVQLGPVLKQIGEYLLLSHRERWDMQRSPDGVPWAPLTETTLGRKTKNIDKILVESGDLRELLRYQIEGDTLRFGTDRIYGAAHQFGMPKGYAGTTNRGSPIPWGDIPARPFLGFSRDDEAEILAIISDHLGGKIA
jgi:phage virion morphogenesis protein